MVLPKLVFSVLVLSSSGVLSGIGIVEICIDSTDSIDVIGRVVSHIQQIGDEGDHPEYARNDQIFDSPSEGEATVHREKH